MNAERILGAWPELMAGAFLVDVAIYSTVGVALVWKKWSKR